MTDTVMQQRWRLRACGYLPIPLFGKTPAPKEWQKISAVSPEQITMWGKLWPTATNTGVLTRLTPTLDLDLMHPEAAERVEEFIGDAFSEKGLVMVRIGKAPKRAIPFRTSTPFKKITIPLMSPMGDTEKIELLADGQQVAVAGDHPETHRPYCWHGGAPWHVPRADLPYLTEDEARALVQNTLLILADFGYAPAGGSARPNGNASNSNGDDRWRTLVGNIAAGRALHDSFRDFACMLIISGMNKGAANHLLHALAELIDHYDTRVEAQLRDIPRAIDSAAAKYRR